MLAPLSLYVRPVIEATEFRDAAGALIAYGDRWASASPPEDSYSVTSNLERFAPLHTVAEALIAHLVAAFDVNVQESTKYASNLLHERDDVTKAVQLVPASAQAANLTFVFTSFPSVIVHAGALQDLLFPVCGCDACDETWEYQADEMEWQVQAIAAGGLRERVSLGPRATYYADLSFPGVASSSGGARLSEFPPGRSRAARQVLNRVRDGWQPWPERVTGE